MIDGIVQWFAMRLAMYLLVAFVVGGAFFAGVTALVMFGLLR